MSTHTRRSHDVEFEQTLGRAGGQRGEPGGRARLLAGGAPAAGGLPDVPVGRELPRELADEAVDRARVRRAVDELDGACRERLVEALLEQLGDERDPLPEELRERLLDGMLGGLLAGRRGECEILGSDGLLGELTRRLVERALREELTEHLGYPAGRAPPGGRATRATGARRRRC